MSWHSVQWKAWSRLLKGIRNAEAKDNGKYKRQKRWSVIYSQAPGEGGYLKMRRLTKQGQHVLQKVNVPAGRGSAWVLVRKCVCHSGGGEKAPGKQKGTAATNFQTPKFWGWVKKLGKRFNIWTSSILLFCNMKMVFHDYKEAKNVL